MPRRTRLGSDKHSAGSSAFGSTVSTLSNLRYSYAPYLVESLGIFEIQIKFIANSKLIPLPFAQQKLGLKPQTTLQKIITNQSISLIPDPEANLPQFHSALSKMTGTAPQINEYAGNEEITPHVLQYTPKLSRRALKPTHT